MTIRTHAYFAGLASTDGTGTETVFKDGMESAVLRVESATAAALIPAGTTAQRPATPAAGQIRFNSTTGELEWYNGTSWESSTVNWEESGTVFRPVADATSDIGDTTHQVRDLHLDRRLYMQATDGQLLIGHTANGYFSLASLTAGSNVTITPGAGTITIAASGGAGTPGGADTQVQFNDGGAFGGDAGMTYNKTTDTLTLVGSVFAGAATEIGWTGRATMRSTADGIVVISNDALDDFTRLCFGGTSNAFPALKRNGDSISVVKADNSDSSGLSAGSLEAVNGLWIFNAGGYRLYAHPDSKIHLNSSGVYKWTDTADAVTGTPDTGLARNAAGVVEFNNGTAGTFRDAKLRHIEIDGDLNHDGTGVGFYGTAPVALQTGVAVTAAGVHAALVNLGLITA